jgi:crossover junction endodeoxyribonuclease RuvC
MKVFRILGIDPGSRLTGYGCVDLVGNQLQHVCHGTLKIASTSGKATVSLDDRLLLIHQGLSEVITQVRPHVMVVEKVFFAKNALSALKLGQARGAAILTGKIHGLEIAEYSPTEVKAAVSGYGQADKDQIARMVGILLGQKNFVTSDASDALALAICHAYRLVSQPVAAASQKPSLSTQLSSGKKKRMSLAESLGVAAVIKKR